MIIESWQRPATRGGREDGGSAARSPNERAPRAPNPARQKSPDGESGAFSFFLTTIPRRVTILPPFTPYSYGYAPSARTNQSLCEADMTHQTFSLNTAVLFFLIALLHAVRLLRGWRVTIEGAVVPIWISWIALAIAAYLAYEGFRLAKTKTK